MKANYVHKDTLTATDCVELNKNNELLITDNQSLLKENQELKKQLEEINKMIEKCGFANIEQVMLNYCGLLTQQKKFIKFLEDELLHARYYARDIAHYIEYVLRKYKEITQTKNDKSV